MRTTLSSAFYFSYISYCPRHSQALVEPGNEDIPLPHQQSPYFFTSRLEPRQLCFTLSPSSHARCSRVKGRCYRSQRICVFSFKYSFSLCECDDSGVVDLSCASVVLVCRRNGMGTSFNRHEAFRTWRCRQYPTDPRSRDVIVQYSAFNSHVKKKRTLSRAFRHQSVSAWLTFLSPRFNFLIADFETRCHRELRPALRQTTILTQSALTNRNSNSIQDVAADVQIIVPVIAAQPANKYPENLAMLGPNEPSTKKPQKQSRTPKPPFSSAAQPARK